MKRTLPAALLAATTACSHPTAPYPAIPRPDMAEIQANAAAMGATMAKTAADCPWPATGTYGHTGEVTDPSRRPAPLTPAIMQGFTPGCAIIAFTVDEDGAPTHASIAAANPPAAGPIALGIVQQRTYARGETPDTAFLIRLGLDKHPDGSFSISEMSR